MILFSTAVDYSVGRALGYQQNLKKRRLLLWTSVVGQLDLETMSFENFELEDEDFIHDGDHVSKGGAVRTTNWLLAHENR